MKSSSNYFTKYDGKSPLYNERFKNKRHNKIKYRISEMKNLNTKFVSFIK